MASIDLIVCRHSFTNSVKEAGSDHRRTLTKEGRDKAEAVGHRLHTLNLIPTVALVTSAIRTYETAVSITTNTVRTIEVPKGYPGQPDFSPEDEKALASEYQERCKQIGHGNISYNAMMSKTNATQRWMSGFFAQAAPMISSLADQGHNTILLVGHGPSAIGLFASPLSDLLKMDCPPCTTVYLEVDPVSLRVISERKIT
tara:strand:- start:147 stop:746 length:600 start_codon:yes stop_codon:yes gene_type:complete